MGFQDLLNDIEQNDVEPQAQETTPEPVQEVQVAEQKQDQFVPTIDISKFNSQELQIVEKAKDEINLSDSNSLLYFGSNVQGKIAEFADGILDGVKTKNTEHVGSNLTDLLVTIKGVDIENLNKKRPSKIPFLERIKKGAQSAKVGLQSVTETVDSIVVGLDKSRQSLIRDVNVLDALYKKNLEYLHDLELYVAAGEQKYKEIYETTLVNLKNKAEQSQDMLDIQKYNDFAQMLTEIEKRIYDLKISREIALQTLPQIRLMQNNDKVLANKIQSSILTTIPIWKNQIALSISLQKQKAALEIQKKVTETTEDMLKRNAEMLKSNTLEIARESEKGVVSIETLRETHSKLLETIDESMKIYEEGKVNRQNVEKELVQMEAAQRQKLLEYRNK